MFGRLFAVFLFTLLPLGNLAMAVEETPYTPVLQQGAFSIRDYPARIVAEVTVPGDQSAAVSAGFRLLAHYIFGGNQGRRSIAMTAPVAQTPTGATIPMTAPVSQLRAGDQWVVRFFMPAGETLANLPQPDDPRVKLVELPPSRAAVLRFSGWAGKRDFAARAADLLQMVAARHLQAAGPVTLAQYNPPWTLWFMRRNEVMVELRP